MNYLNPELDLAALRKALDARGRVLIRNFFRADVAEALARAVDAIDWSLSYRDGTADQLLSGPTLRAQSADERARLVQGIHGVAEREFQFSFFSHSLVHAAQRGEVDLLTRFVRWMADEPFLHTLRRISGIESVNRVYAQATMYSRGSFLLSHDDHVSAEDRKLAYVINLTRHWRPDWGGLLQFPDEEGNLVDSFFPHFNSMSLFTVPQTHFVSYVPPFAGAERTAITGWLIAA